MARTPRKSGQAVTMQAVADRAGVSAMTVSHVINGTKKLREETRDAVLAAIEALGYVPNVAARALASAQSTRIGIVYRNAQNAFLSAMLVGTLNAAARLGAQVIIRKCDSFSTQDATDAVSSLLRSGANAILLAPPYSELLTGTDFSAGLKVPVAAIAHGDALDDMDSIGVDEMAAARAMTEHLIGRDHRRIGFVTGPETHSAAARRLAGYNQALAAHGITADPALVQPGDFSFESGLVAAAALLDLPEPPTAIFASNDDMAAAASLIAHQRGLRIPEDLAVAGFDDAPIAVKIWPPLTTVRQEIDHMAERATEIMVARHREGGRPDQTLSEQVGFAVIEREST
ncbi:LacI family DNA-binding transcriptional regulator [Sphingobium rhizovicinum]|uniref:LacI family DNA-binding transcriptional regulator n=1 Tax=Sphingobium rhizovicinum TaxID=432308 RepID=A0ABV7NE76_9SPHN